MVDHTATVKAMYDAFGRGDNDFILQQVAPNVEWIRKPSKPNVAQEAGVAELAPFYGQEGVREYFRQWHERVENKKFEVLKFAAGDDTVVAWIDSTFIVKKTGEEVDDFLIHEFVFNSEGKVSTHFVWCDTAKHMAAQKCS